MSERFTEEDLQQILAILDIAEGRIQQGDKVSSAFDFAKAEIVDYKEGGPPMYGPEREEV
jgi:hypothetical protein